jgi:DNA-binding Xre family transcriptional regulator
MTEYYLNSIIGHNLQRLLIEKGLRPVDVVRRSGICKSHVSEIMNGKITHPTIWTCVRLAEAIGCSLDDLVKS